MGDDTGLLDVLQQQSQQVEDLIGRLNQRLTLTQQLYAAEQDRLKSARQAGQMEARLRQLEQAIGRIDAAYASLPESALPEALACLEEASAGINVSAVTHAPAYQRAAKPTSIVTSPAPALAPVAVAAPIPAVKPARETAPGSVLISQSDAFADLLSENEPDEPASASFKEADLSGLLEMEAPPLAAANAFADLLGEEGDSGLFGEAQELGASTKKDWWLEDDELGGELSSPPPAPAAPAMDAAEMIGVGPISRTTDDMAQLAASPVAAPTPAPAASTGHRRGLLGRFFS